MCVCVCMCVCLSNLEQSVGPYFDILKELITVNDIRLYRDRGGENYGELTTHGKKSRKVPAFRGEEAF